MQRVLKLRKLNCAIGKELSIFVLLIAENVDNEYERSCTQLAHVVVTTLDFGCILVATSDNVVTTLSQRCVSDVVTTTKN